MNEQAQPQKKGFSPLAWIAIGCVGLIVIAAIVFGIGTFFVAKKVAEVGEEMMENPARSMAEMVIKMNPETKFIESDDETVTFETEDGETVTLNFEDIQNGNFSMTSDDGETSSISFGPAGVSGTTESEGGEQADFNIFGGGSDTSNVPDQMKYPGADSMTPMVASRGNGEFAGMLTYKTSSSMDDVIAWHTDSLDDCEVSRTDIAGSRNTTLSCGEDSVTLTFMGQDGDLQVMANYKIVDD